MLSGFDREQPVRRVDDFGLIAGLLVGPHQQLQRVFLHHAVGILGEECFQSADLGRGIGLLHGADIGVVFGGILDFFFLWLRLLREWCCCGWDACGCARGARPDPMPRSQRQQKRH